MNRPLCRTVWTFCCVGVVFALTQGACARSGLLIGEPALANADGDLGEDSVQEPPHAGAHSAPEPDRGREDAAVGDDAQVRVPPRQPAPPLESCDGTLASGIVLVTSARELFRFEPASGELEGLGFLSCTDGFPFSMAIDRTGTAFVLVRPDVFQLQTPPGELFRTTTLSGSCHQVLEYVPAQQGFTYFGMSMLGEPDRDILYIAGGIGAGDQAGLATLDLESFELTFVGTDLPVFERVEVTSTPDGRLFALFRHEGMTTVFLGELDRLTGRVLSRFELEGLVFTDLAPGSRAGGGFAMSQWNGGLYIFLSDTERAVVHRVEIDPPSIQEVASFEGLNIVGAGRAPCQ